MKKIILSVVLIMASLFLISCGDITTGTTTQSQTTTEGNTTQDQTTTENQTTTEGNTTQNQTTTEAQTTEENTTTEEAVSLVKIKSIKTVENEPSTVKMAKRSVNLMSKIEKENIQYILLYKNQTDTTFTIELDNPEAYGIDSLRITCDDPDSKILMNGVWEPIQRESDGTIVVNWASENPYIKTYQIRTTSEDAINSFRVVDIRLAGHEKFQSKETGSEDLGNNELKIYKILSDAYTVETVVNQLDLKTLAVNVKDENISNLKLNGLAADENGHWNFTESGKATIEYDYTIPGIGVTLSRSDEIDVEVIKFVGDETTSILFKSDGIIRSFWLGFNVTNTEYEVIFNGESLTYGAMISDAGVCWDTYTEIEKLEGFPTIIHEQLRFSNKTQCDEFMKKFIIKISGIEYYLEFGYNESAGSVTEITGLVEV